MDLLAGIPHITFRNLETAPPDKLEAVTGIQEFIHRLPKAELHLHLEGAILPATLVELSARHDVRPLTLVEAEALYQFTDFTGFLNAFKAVTAQLIEIGRAHV